jgi:hypothetical protein
MSKCRPDCCSSSRGDGSGVATIGFIVLAAVAYGIIHAVVHAVEAIVHVVIEIIEITAITVGSIAAVALLILIAVRISAWRHRQTHRAGLPVKAIVIDPAVPPIVAGRGPGKPALDTAALFAEAVASPDMDSRFIEKILRNAMRGPDQ